MKVSQALVVVGIIALTENAVSAVSFQNRIVGGTDALKGRYPYQATISGTFAANFCGGAILNAYHVITAAQCLENSPRRIRVGLVSLLEENVQEHYISSTIQHPKYNPVTLENDLAILRLKTPIEFSEYVQSIPLDSSYINENEDVVVTGWGRLTFTGGKSVTLQQLNLTTISNTVCSNDIDGLERVTDGVLCTLTKRGEGMCYGDAGSPLAANGSLVGIVSWGIKPCGLGAPDVFARISPYVNWIKETIS